MIDSARSGLRPALRSRCGIVPWNVAASPARRSTTGLIAVSALVSRIRQRHLDRPSKMPLWPVPPIIALAGVVVALTKQKGSDLWTCVAIFAAALLYYFLFVRPRSDRYWTVSGAVPDPEPTATSGTTEP